MRRLSVPSSSLSWGLVAAGAMLYWTVALGLGLPSFGNLIGVDSPRPSPRLRYESRCVPATTVDGRTVAFGDCINVRFMHDAPHIPRPAALDRAGGYTGSVVPPELPAAVDQDLPESDQNLPGRTAY